jgi:hypothetical protein
MGSEKAVYKDHTSTHDMSKAARSQRAFANPQIVVMSEGIFEATNPVSKERTKHQHFSLSIS